MITVQIILKKTLVAKNGVTPNCIDN